MIADIDIIIGRQQDREAAADRPMLHRVVQDDDVQVLHLALELLDAFDPVLTDRYRQVGEGGMHLHGLIADGLDGGSMVRHDETACLTFITAREDSGMVTVSDEQAYEIGRHRRLTCTAYR